MAIRVAALIVGAVAVVDGQRGILALFAVVLILIVAELADLRGLVACLSRPQRPAPEAMDAEAARLERHRLRLDKRLRLICKRVEAYRAGDWADHELLGQLLVEVEDDGRADGQYFAPARPSA